MKTQIQYYIKNRFSFLDLFFYVQEITENGRYLPSVLWKGSIPVYITDNPEEIQILLNSPHGLSKTSQYRFMKDAIGEALIVGEGIEIYVILLLFFFISTLFSFLLEVQQKNNS